MGINAQVATVIAYLKANNFVGKEILSLGRQDKAFSLKDLRNINRNVSAGWTDSQMEASVKDPSAETFLNLCGFKVSRAIDASDFEGADIVHDLNLAIPEHLQDITSFFYDGGTLEHVFDVATSFKNAFDLLKVGGIALFAPPANNQCGHGFYQFSPELFFRVLSANGFDSIHVYLVTTNRPTKWLKCVDPSRAGRRYQFYSGEPLQLIAIARKAKRLQSLVIPQQSDYAESAWDETAEGRESRRRSHAGSVSSAIASRLAFPVSVVARTMFGISLGGRLPGLWRRSMVKFVSPEKDVLFSIQPSISSTQCFD
jgi:hypothetical protein